MRARCSLTIAVTSVASEKAIAARSYHQKGRHQVRCLQYRCGSPESVIAFVNYSSQYPTHYSRNHEEYYAAKQHMTEPQNGPDCHQGNAYETHRDC